MKILKVSHLKKLPVGFKLRQTHNLFGPCDKLREVSRVQSNGVWFKQLDKPGESRESWLQFPTAKDFVATEDGFEIREGDTVACKYSYVVEAPATLTLGAGHQPPTHFIWPE